MLLYLHEAIDFEGLVQNETKEKVMSILYKSCLQRAALPWNEAVTNYTSTLGSAGKW